MSKRGLAAARRHVIQVVDKGVLRPSRHDHNRPARRGLPSPVSTQIFKGG